MIFIAVGVVLVVGYNLEIWHGRLHNGTVFALGWGSFPLLTAYYAQAGATCRRGGGGGLRVLVVTGATALEHRGEGSPAPGGRRRGRAPLRGRGAGGASRGNRCSSRSSGHWWLFRGAPAYLAPGSCWHARGIERKAKGDGSERPGRRLGTRSRAGPAWTWEVGRTPGSRTKASFATFASGRARRPSHAVAPQKPRRDRAPAESAGLRRRVQLPGRCPARPAPDVGGDPAPLGPSQL